MCYANFERKKEVLKMFQLYIKKKGGFAPNLKGEYLTIEETNGGVNSYGELLTEVVEKG